MNSDTKPTDSRHLSRVLAAQYIFSHQAQQSLEDIHESLSPFEPNSVIHELEEKKYSNKLYEKLTEGTLKYLKEIDETIQKMAPSWPIDQINPVDLAILRIAIWEAFIGCINPDKVVINEAIELGKEIGAKESSSFINGVLGSIINNKNIREYLKKLQE